MNIKTDFIIDTHNKSIAMLLCGYCGEGVSNRPEDDKAAKEFKAEHKACKKDKNNKIDLKHLPDAPI